MASRKQIIEAAMRAAVADATYVPPERQIIAELQALRKEMTKPPQQVNYLSLAREFLAQRLSLADDVNRAAKETQADPSDAQKQAGNYAKGHVTIHGLPVSIETAKGQTRSGKAADGTEWSVKMPHHYGYIRRTESEADGDHIDCFIGPNPESEIVFIVNQLKPSGRFDEHKCMLGFTNAKDAKDGYLAAYSPNWTGFGSMSAMTIGQFKEWIEKGDTKRAVMLSRRRPAVLLSRAPFDKEKHPRGRDGKFIDHDDIGAAVHDANERRSLLRKLDDENKGKLWGMLREHAARAWEEEARAEHTDDSQADDDEWQEEALNELPSYDAHTDSHPTDADAEESNKTLEESGSPYRIVRIMPDPPLTPEEWDEQNPEPEEPDESASDEEYATWEKAHAAWDKAGDAAIAADKAWTDKYYEKWSEYESPFGLEHKDRPGKPVNMSRRWMPGSLFNLSGGWTAFQGPRGGRGWRSNQTGRIVYQAEMPGSNEHQGASQNEGQGGGAAQSYQQPGNIVQQPQQPQQQDHAATLVDMAKNGHPRDWDQQTIDKLVSGLPANQVQSVAEAIGMKGTINRKQLHARFTDRLGAWMRTEMIGDDPMALPLEEGQRQAAERESKRVASKKAKQAAQPQAGRVKFDDPVIQKAADGAHEMVKEWQDKLAQHGVKVVLGGSLVSGLALPSDKHDADIRFLYDGDRKALIPEIEKATGLKFRKTITVGGGDEPESDGHMIEGEINRNGIKYDVEGALRNSRYTGWANYYPQVLTPQELDQARNKKMELRGDKKAYKEFKNTILAEVQKRVKERGLLKPAAAHQAQQPAQQAQQPPAYKAGESRIHKPANSLGIPRAQMPQIGGKHVHEFLDDVKQAGFKVTSGIVPVGQLKPTQAELNLDQMELLGKKLPPEKLASPVIASSDGYILDGHHRWGELHRQNPNHPINVHKIDMPIHQLLEAAKTFPHTTYKDPSDLAGKGLPPLDKVPPLEAPSHGEDMNAWLDKAMQHPYIQEAQRRLEAGKETHDTEIKWDKRPGSTKDKPVWDPERVKHVHEPIINGFLNPAAKAAPGERPKAVFLIGPFGAGKSTAGEPIVHKMMPNFTLINPDEIKSGNAAKGRPGLPEDEGWNATHIHEESSHISKQIAARAKAERHHLLFDGSGQNGEKMNKQASELHNMGYDVHVVHVTVPPEVSVHRAASRFLENPYGMRDKDKKPTRYAPLKYVYHEVGSKPDATYQLLKNNPHVKSGKSFSTHGVKLGDPVPMVDSWDRQEQAPAGLP